MVTDEQKSLATMDEPIYNRHINSIEQFEKTEENIRSRKIDQAIKFYRNIQNPFEFFYIYEVWSHVDDELLNFNWKIEDFA
jgi:hypothetical protein